MMLWIMLIGIVFLFIVVFLTFSAKHISIDDVIDITADAAKKAADEARRVPRVIG